MGPLEEETGTSPTINTLTQDTKGQQHTSYVRGSIEGTEVNILVDSGATESFISADFRRTAPTLHKRPLKADFVAARAVNGQMLDTLGTITATLHLGNNSWQHVFHVLRGSTQTALLGLDFLVPNRALLDYAHGTLQLWDTIVPLLCGKDLIPECCNVSITTATTLPPLSEMLVPVCVTPTRPVDQSPDFVGYLKPNIQNKCECVVAHAVTSVKKGVTLARVLNPTHQDITLREGTHLGEFFSVDESEIVPLTHAPVKTVSAISSTELPLVSLQESPASQQQKEKIAALLAEHQEIFNMTKGVAGKCTLIKHSIKTGDHPPIRQRAYRASPDKKEEIDRQVEALLEDGVIEGSFSPWAAPVVLVKKKNGEWRFCIDYRRLNSITVKDCHPLPRVDDTLDALAGSLWFSTLDFSNGYWQVEVAEEDREKTAFTTGRGLYQWRSMPMGLTNSPATFQRMMELVLRGLPWQVCMVYLDDVLIYSPTFEDHLCSLRKVFSRIQAAGLRLNPKKCHLARDHVVFLGHVVSRHGLQPDPRNTDKVRSWPTPKNPTEVRAFVGLCSYYRRFVRDFAQRAAPLHRLTCKDVPFQWTTECDAAFEYLKGVLSAAPVVTMPDFNIPFKVYTDASMEAVGAVLAQDKDGLERVVVYASQSLSATEKRWSTFDRELWAVVWAVRQFRHYIGAAAFTIVTDHKPLLGLRGMSIDKDPTGRRARWILELDPFNWVMKHKHGHQHANADALSRRPPEYESEATDSCQQEMAAHVNTIDSEQEAPAPPSHPPGPHLPAGGLQAADAATRGQYRDMNREPDDLSFLSSLSQDGAGVAELQRADPDTSRVLDWIGSNGSRPPRDQMRGQPRRLRKLWTEFPRLSVVNGLLCRTVNSPTTGGAICQVVVPSSLVPEVLQHLHGGPIAAHFSADRVWERARQTYFWPFMFGDIQQWCEQCVPCQTRRAPVPRHRAPMGGVQASRPFQRVATDILELPMTSKGSRYVLVVEDYFTKFVNLYALPNQTAQSVAQCLFDDYVLLHGIPEALHSDQGRQFESEIVQRLCQLLGITKTRTAPYNPKSDGMVERFNRTLISQLAKALLATGGEWDDYLKSVGFAYNTSVHASTGYTPFYLVHGREARVPVDVLVPSQRGRWGVFSSQGDYVTSLVEKLETAFGAARRSSTCAREKQKLYHDGTARHRPYAVGDLVWLRNPTEDRMKLAPHWKGPFRILAVLGSQEDAGLTYRIGCPLDSDGHEQVVHYDRLKPYTLPLPPGSLSSSSPPSVLSRLEDGLFHVAEEPLIAGGVGSESATGSSEPPPRLSRFGRAVRQPVHFKDFVTVQ